MVVTGATGFIGSNLVRALIGDGVEVHIIVRSTSEMKNIEDAIHQINVFEFDGKFDPLCEYFNKVKPDVILHLASLFVAEHKSDQIDDLVESNLTFGLKLVEAASRSGINKFINTGTSWQHYHDKPYDPVCLYAATKEAFEKLLDFYVSNGSLDVISLHLFDTYGETDKRPKLINLLNEFLLNGTKLDMSPGEQKLDLVHVEDVVRAYKIAINLLELNKVKGHEVFGVSSGEHVSLKQLINLFQIEFGREIIVNWGGRSYRKREVMEPWSTYKSLPGWKPMINIRDGINRIRLYNIDS